MKENPEFWKKHREWQKIWNKTTLKGRFCRYKGVAKIRNIPFNLTKEDFIRFWQKPCIYCGQKIDTIGLD